MAIILQDTFTGIAGTRLSNHTSDSGSTWTKLTISGQSGDFVLDGNGAIYPTDASSLVYASSQPQSSNFSIFADFIVPPGGTSTVGIFVAGRIDPQSLNRYSAGRLDDEWVIYNGSTLISRAENLPNLQPNTTYAVEFRVHGSSLRLFVDGEQVCGATNTDLTGGYTGVRASNSYDNPEVAGIRIANFRVVENDVNPTSINVSGSANGSINSPTTFTFSLFPIGSIVGSVTVTPTMSNLAGAWNPATISLSTEVPSGTSQFTPTAIGTGSVSCTNDGGLGNPSPITFNSQSTISAGTLTLTSYSSTKINFSVTSAGGGTTNQLEISDDPLFTNSTDIVGATNLAMEATPLDSNLKWFRVRQSSGATTVYTNVVAGRIKSGPIRLGFIGSSSLIHKVENRNSVDALSDHLSHLRDEIEVIATNCGVSGSTSQSWLSAGSMYQSALPQLLSANVTHVGVLIGANDAGNNVSVSQWKQNMSDILDNLVYNGFKVVLLGIQCPTLTAYGGNPNTRSLISDYLNEYNALADGKNVFCPQGYRQPYILTSMFPSAYMESDGLHPNANGIESNGKSWATQFDDVINKQLSGTNGFINNSFIKSV